MASTAKGPQPEWPLHSLLGQFRPEPGWILDQACISSYSADVRVVTAALLALSGAASDPELGSPVQLVQALRDLRGRVAVLVQRGRILRPRKLPKIAGLLDRFLFEANCDERSHSWHAKFALMRWKRKEDGAVAWRAWLGSRNLTRDLSRDAGLLLTEDEGREQGYSLPGLRHAVEALQARLPKSAGRFPDEDLRRLGRVRWIAPSSVSDLRVHWLDGKDNKFPGVGEPQQEIIVLSPFVDAVAIRRTLDLAAFGAKPIVVSSSTELGRECRRDATLSEHVDLRVCAIAVEEGAAYEQPEDRADQDPGDAERELDRSDEATALHAKLMYTRLGRERRLWIGSPNLTGRAWSRNLEIVAELVSAANKDPWGPVLREIANNSARFEADATVDPKDTDEKDTLEDVRKGLAATLSCHQERRGDAVHVVAERSPGLNAGAVQLLVGLPWAECEPVIWQSGMKEIGLGPVELASCTDLLLFVLRDQDEELGWLMHAPFRPSLAESRDNAGIAKYLGPHGYLDLIRAELDAGKVSAPPWDGSGINQGNRNSRNRDSFGLPTLEGLLRLYLREPERLHTVAKTVAMLEKEAVRWEGDAWLSADARNDLVNFKKLWDGVGVFLTRRAYP